MNTTNKVLATILIAQIVLAVVVFWPRAADYAGDILFKGAEGNDITRLEIIDADNNRVLLARSDDEWVMPEAGNFVADSDKIDPILDNIKALRTNRLVTMTSDSHASLEVAEDKFQRRLKLTWADGEQKTLYLGSSGGAGATHFRQAGKDEVFITGDITIWSAVAQASSYIDTLYFSVPRDSVTSLILENANGTFEFVKDDDTWRYLNLGESEQFKDSELTTLLTQTTSLRMAAPLGIEEKPSYGLADPQVILTLQADSDVVQHQYELRIGVGIGEHHVAISSDSSYFVSISSYTANSLINKTHRSFLDDLSEDELETSG